MWNPSCILIIFDNKNVEKTYKTAKEIGLEDSQLKTAMKTSAITAIGPSVACLGGMFAVMAVSGWSVGL